MTPRTLVIGDKTFKWAYIKSKVLIWDENGKKHVFDDTAVTNMTPDGVERGKWKRWFSITPGVIKTFIEERAGLV